MKKIYFIALTLIDLTSSKKDYVCSLENTGLIGNPIEYNDLGRSEAKGAKSHV